MAGQTIGNAPGGNLTPATSVIRLPVDANTGSPSTDGKYLFGSQLLQAATGNSVINAADPAYGVVADCGFGHDGAITSGAAIFTSAGASFTTADVGKRITIGRAGASNITFTTTILSRQSATQVTLAANAGATVTGASYGYGTDNTTAITNALNAVTPGGTVLLPIGMIGLYAGGITVPQGVRLLGQCFGQPHHSTQHGTGNLAYSNGTMILILGGAGTGQAIDQDGTVTGSVGTSPFSLTSAAGIEGIAFYYPAQPKGTQPFNTAPVVYPPTISVVFSGTDPNYIINPFIKNCEFIATYWAMMLDGIASITVRDCEGHILGVFIYADRIYDVSYFENIIASIYWRVDSSGNIDDWTKSHVSPFIFMRVDLCMASSIFSFSYYWTLLFLPSRQAPGALLGGIGEPWGYFDKVGGDNNTRGIGFFKAQSLGIHITHASLTDLGEHGLYLGSTNGGYQQVTDSTINCTGGLTCGGPGRIQIQDCTLNLGTTIDLGSFGNATHWGIVQNCMFINNINPHITISSNAQRAIITGNITSAGLNVTNGISTNALIVDNL